MIFYEEVLREFQKKKVKYVLVGGVAFNMLGLMRSTSDLDLIVKMSDSNLAKIVKILKNQKYYVKQPINPMEIANRKIRENWINNKGMKAFNFYKSKGWQEVDIIIDSPISFEKAKKNAVLYKIGNIKIPVISIDNLIKMKKASGRKIDKMDISELKKLKKLKGKK